METSRRRFLGGLAVATALTGTAAAHAPINEENSDLLALGKEFDEVHARFLAAADELPATQEAYRAIAPSGDGLVFSERSRGPQPFVLDWFRDPTSPKHSDVILPDGSRAMKVCSWCIERQLEAGTLTHRYYAPLLERARKFEADIEAATKVSGLAAALDLYWREETELRRVVYRLAQIRAKTTAGIALKVRATAAYAALGTEERFTASQWISRAIWEDMGEDA